MTLPLAGLLTLVIQVSPSDISVERRFEFTSLEMAAPARIVLYTSDEDRASDAARAAFGRIRELNSILSDYDPSSELSRLCREATEGVEVDVSDDLWRVLTRAGEISQASGGAFDASIGPLVELWRRARREHRLPAPELLEAARGLVDHRLVRCHPDRSAVTLLRPGLRLDLGGIA